MLAPADNGTTHQCKSWRGTLSDLLLPPTLLRTVVTAECAVHRGKGWLPDAPSDAGAGRHVQLGCECIACKASCIPARIASLLWMFKKGMYVLSSSLQHTTAQLEM